MGLADVQQSPRNSAVAEAGAGWLFWHPSMRIVLSFTSIFLALVLYAEDPVGHSEDKASLRIAGPVINILLWTLRRDLLCTLAVLGCLFGGIVFARLVLHPWLRDALRLSMFGHLSAVHMTQVARQDGGALYLAAQRTKGRFALMVVVVLVLLWMAAHALPVAVGIATQSPSTCGQLLAAVAAAKKKGRVTVSRWDVRIGQGLASAPCALGATLPIINADYTRLAAVLTLALDLTALLFLVETMLMQDGLWRGGTAGSPQIPSSPLLLLTRAPLYKREVGILRRFDRGLRCGRCPRLSPAACLVAAAMLFGMYMMHALPLRWVGSCSERGRVFLASARLFADVLLVVQDWEFPHFRQLRRISFGSLFDSHVTGKWMNYGILACTLLLDLNTVRYHLVYSPLKFGQVVQEDTFLIMTPKGHHHHLKSAYSYFYGYGLEAKLLFTFPMWVAVAVLLFGLKHWRVRPPQVGVDGVWGDGTVPPSMSPSSQGLLPIGVNRSTSPATGGAHSASILMLDSTETTSSGGNNGIGVGVAGGGGGGGDVLVAGVGIGVCPDAGGNNSTAIAQVSPSPPPMGGVSI